LKYNQNKVDKGEAIIPLLCMQSKNAAAKVLKNKFFDCSAVASADIEEILK
jgi:hypothetical protein